jgi:hypothetical protein
MKFEKLTLFLLLNYIAAKDLMNEMGKIGIEVTMFMYAQIDFIIRTK